MLVEENCFYIKSEAVLRTLLNMRMPLPLLAGLALLVPKFIRDMLYDQVGLAGNACSNVLACKCLQGRLRGAGHMQWWWCSSMHCSPLSPRLLLLFCESPR